MDRDYTMDRDYMLYMIKDRMEYLHNAYVKACAHKDASGNVISYSNARAIRYNSKKDLNMLKLLEYLIDNSDITELADDDMKDAFSKFVEPRVLRLRK